MQHKIKLATPFICNEDLEIVFDEDNGSLYFNLGEVYKFEIDEKGRLVDIASGVIIPKKYSKHFDRITKIYERGQ